MATTIKCNKCGNQIEVTEAIRKELEEKVLQETQEKHEQEILKLKQQQEALRKQKDDEIEKVKQEITKTARKDAIEKVRKEYDTKIEATKEESDIREKQYRESQQQLSETISQLREAKNAESKLKLEYEKKLLAGQDKIKSDAKKEAEEELNFRIAEKDKKISDAQKQIKELERKIQQGSQQLQGEIQELSLEDQLKSAFQTDEIKGVPKGIRGADIIQIVRNIRGMESGTIAWESKNTKIWTESWVQKLKDDQRILKAEIAVIVSVVLPEGIKLFGLYKGVWVCDLKSAMEVAKALRIQLNSMYSIKLANRGKETNAEVLYNYVMSNEFKQRIETLVEYFIQRKDELEKEKRYYFKKWEKEQKNIDKVVQNTSEMYGSLQGLIGNSLPQIKMLELPDVD